MTSIPRSSGVLLHPTSLPGRFGVGDLGAGAYRFVDFLAAAKQRWWQVLPLHPAVNDVECAASPYKALSAFAGNPLLISLETLDVWGWLPHAEVEAAATEAARAIADPHTADYDAAEGLKIRLLREAGRRFRERIEHDGQERARFGEFRARHHAWLADYALFMAIREHFEGREWHDWEDPEAVRRTPEALRRYRERLAELVFQFEFEQYVFFRQWTELRHYARDRKVGIIGDIAIYVADNSADVWSNQHLFKLDDRGRPTVVSGVPPDYFSATGQRWGNPIYRWELMRERGFVWWIERLRTVMEQVDLVRLDHFRGFEAYWEVPASEPTAVRGEWVQGPGHALFSALRDALGGRLPIIAEDLGTITPGVEALREAFDLPGMAIMQFAFAEGEQAKSYRPHNYRRNLVAYTGTHDNDTVNGWWADLNRQREGERRDTQGNTVPREAIEAERRLAMTYLGIDEGERNVAPHFIRSLMQSPADLILLPLQDILGLDSSARMNVPGVQQGQWKWRYTPDMLSPDVAGWLREMTVAFGRGD